MLRCSNSAGWPTCSTKLCEHLSSHRVPMGPLNFIILNIKVFILGFNNFGSSQPQNLGLSQKRGCVHNSQPFTAGEMMSLSMGQNMMEWGSNCETTQVSQIINSEAVFRFMPRIIKIFQTGAKCYLQDHPIPYFSWFNSHALDVSVADSPGPNKSHPYPSVIPDLVASCAALSSEIRRFLQAMRG